MSSRIRRFIRRRDALISILLLAYIGLVLLYVFGREGCDRDEDSMRRNGLGAVTALVETSTSRCRQIGRLNIALDGKELRQKQGCVASYPEDKKRGYDSFWRPGVQGIVWQHHDYLTQRSVILDVDGAVGEVAEMFMSKVQPHKYIMLEPMTLMYNVLKRKFKKKKNVVIYNFGLGARNERFYVDIGRYGGSATSGLLSSFQMEYPCTIRVVDTVKFMTKLGVNCIEIDLLTIDCKGCVYEVLEAILGSTLIHSFRNIQFSTNTKDYGRIADPVGRYCTIQQLLNRTHTLTYQFKFNLESWRRKDLVRNKN